MDLNLNRYSRQVLFHGLGEKGQKMLLESTVVIIGCGALGTVQANTIVRAGVGKVVIVDRDFVEKSNLQRQVLFDEQDVKEKLPKAVAAVRKLKKINSEIKIEAIVTDVNHQNIESLIDEADLVLDGVDNFETRYLLDDACIKTKKPWVYGACVGSYGLTMSVVPDVTPCIKCVFEDQPPIGLSPTCDTAGIISPAVNLVASFQVSEGIKILTGQIDALNRGIVTFDLWTNMIKTLKLEDEKPRKSCKCCGLGIFEYLEAKEKNQTYTTSLCGRNAVQVSKGESFSLDFDELTQKLNRLCEVKSNPFIMTFTIDEYEISAFKDGRAIIKGTNEPAIARSVYAKYIGS